MLPFGDTTGTKNQSQKTDEPLTVRLFFFRILRRFVLGLRFCDVPLDLRLIHVKARVAALEQHPVELDEVEAVSKGLLGFGFHLFEIKAAGVVAQIVAGTFETEVVLGVGGFEGDIFV